MRWLLLSAMFLFVSGPACMERADDQTAQEAVGDRILRTKVIRSGYLEYPPYFMKDPNTKALSGLFYEATNLIASRLGCRVDWNEEVGYGTMLEGLGTHYDIIGCGIWANSDRAPHAAFSSPLFYSPVAVFVRESDHRFDADLTQLNSPTVTFATIDGEMSDLVASVDFPQATKLPLPQTAHVSQNLLNLVQGKADVTVCEPHFVQEFMEKNSGRLRNLTVETPVRVFGNTIVLPREDPVLRHMIDVVIADLLNSGQIEAIIRKYEQYPGTYYRVAPGYQLPEAM